MVGVSRLYAGDEGGATAKRGVTTSRHHTAVPALTTRRERRGGGTMGPRGLVTTLATRSNALTHSVMGLVTLVDTLVVKP